MCSTAQSSPERHLLRLNQVEASSPSSPNALSVGARSIPPPTSSKNRPLHSHSQRKLTPLRVDRHSDSILQKFARLCHRISGTATRSAFLQSQLVANANVRQITLVEKIPSIKSDSRLVLAFLLRTRIVVVLFRSIHAHVVGGRRRKTRPGTKAMGSRSTVRWRGRRPQDRYLGPMRSRRKTR